MPQTMEQRFERWFDAVHGKSNIRKDVKKLMKEAYLTAFRESSQIAEAWWNHYRFGDGEKSQACLDIMQTLQGTHPNEKVVV